MEKMEQAANREQKHSTTFNHQQSEATMDLSDELWIKVEQASQGEIEREDPGKLLGGGDKEKVKPKAFIKFIVEIQTFSCIILYVFLSSKPPCHSVDSLGQC